MEAVHTGDRDAAAAERLRYWAFISYSHADERHAQRLHRSLEAYRVPKAMVGSVMVALGEARPRRLFPIFRDRDELASSATLGDALTSALEASRNLIVVCSPSAARSRWVNEEVRRFKAMGRDSRVFCLIVGGEPGTADECFPESVRFRVDAGGVVTKDPAEPIAADARAGGDGEKLARLKLVAGLLDVGFDALRQRDQERRNRQLAYPSAAMAVVATAFGAIALFAIDQRNRAREQLEEATLRRLATESAAIVAGVRPGDESLASQLVLAANDLRPHPEVTAVMRDLVFGYAQTVRSWRLPGAALGVAISPDGTVLAVVGKDPHLRLYDLRDGRLVAEAGPGADARLLAVAFNRTGTMVATGGSEGTLQVWQAATGRPIEPALTGHDGPISSIAFLDDKRLVSGGDDKTVRVWDAGRGSVEVREGHREDVMSVAVASEWGNVVSASTDNTIIRWPLTGGRPGKPWEGQHGAVSSVAVSPDFETVVSGNWDGMLMLWKKDGSPIDLPLQGHQGRVHGVAYSRDGAHIASVGEDRTVRLWDGVNGRALGKPMRGHTGEVASVAFGSDGRSLASASVDGTVRLWALPIGERLGPPVPPHGDRAGIALSADGQRALVKDRDGRPQLWDVSSARPLTTDPALAAISPQAAMFSTDGSRLLTLMWRGEVQLWEGSSGKSIGALNNDGKALAMDLSPDSKLVATAGEDGLVRLLDAAGTPADAPRVLEPASSKVMHVAFSPDGSRVAGVLEDGSAAVWDATEGRLVLKLGPPLASRVRRVAYGGNRIVAGAEDGTLAMWDATSGQLIAGPIEAHRGAVEGLAFAPGDTLFASSGHDKQLRFWDVGAAAPVGAALDGGSTGGYDVVFARDAPVFLWIGQGGVRLWPAPTAWVDVLCRRLDRSFTAQEWNRYVGEGMAFRDPCRSTTNNMRR